MSRPIAEWLKEIRDGLELYSKVFVDDGADDEASLDLYTAEDEPALESQLDAAGCARLNRRLIISALRARRQPKEGESVRAATPQCCGPRSCSSSSGLGSFALPSELDEDEEHEADERWVPLSKVRPVPKKRKVQRTSLLSPEEPRNLSSCLNGKSRLPDMGAVERTGSRASQSSESSRTAGTARLMGNQGGGGLRDKDAVCARCSLLLSKVKAKADEEARRTSAEVARLRQSTAEFSRGHSTYNFSKLKTILNAECFDAMGNYIFHCTCIQLTFDVSHTFMANLHASIINDRGASLEEKRVEVPTPHSTQWQQLLHQHRYTLGSLVVRLSKDLQERMVLPADCTLSRSAYLRSLADGSAVSVLKKMSVHGLSGQPSNHTLWEQKNLFIQFIKSNRSATGRTSLQDGLHGAEFYMNSQFTCVKPVSAKGRKQQLEGSAAAAAAVHNEEDADSMPGIRVMSPSCLSDVFISSLRVYSPHLKVPGATAILCWFRDLFGSPKAPHGHTTLFPKKSDACSTCCEDDMELKKLNASISRHLQHVEDAGSITRQAALAELRTMLAEVTERRDRHKREATAEQEFYKERSTKCAADYRRLCSLYARVCRQDGTADVEEFLRLLSVFSFEMASDYQQDKSYPYWGASPQPGETYFMSKITVYVHIILFPGCGGSVQRRNKIFLRDQQLAGSKDCNDTLCTIFEALRAPVTPTCKQPSLFRTGYEQSAVHPSAQTVHAAESLGPKTSMLQPGTDAATCEEREAAVQDAVADAFLDLFALQTESPAMPVASLDEALVCSPQHFIRRLRWQLDAAGGTNKNNFVKQGIALAVSCACADVIDMDYMVVGHTKFAPDEVAQKTAGAYNRSDVWNQRHLQNLFSPYCECVSYDKELLMNFHVPQLSEKLFGRIQHIMSFRHFRFVGDDGHFSPPRSMWAAPAIPLKRAQQDNVQYILENFDPPLGGVWKANIDTPGITQLREYLEANWTGEGLPLKGGAAPLSPYVGYAATSDKYSETTQKLNTLGISGSETRRQSCLQHLPGLGAIHGKVCIELIKQLNLSELPKLHNFHILRQYHEADGGSGFGPHIDEADDSGGPPAFSVVVKLTADPPGSSGSWMQVLEPEPLDPVRYDADAGSSTIFLSRRYHQSLRTPLDMGKVLKLVLFFNYKAPNNSKKSTQSSSQPSQQGSSKPTMNEAHKNKASTSKSAQRKRPAPATASVKAPVVDPSTQADLGCRVTAGCVLGRAHWGECSVPEDATLGGRKRRGAK